MESQRKPLTTKYGRRLTHLGVEKKFPSLVVVARWHPYPNFAYSQFEAICISKFVTVTLFKISLAMALTAGVKRSKEYCQCLVSNILST